MSVRPPPGPLEGLSRYVICDCIDGGGCEEHHDYTQHSHERLVASWELVERGKGVRGVWCTEAGRGRVKASRVTSDSDCPLPREN